MKNSQSNLQTWVHREALIAEREKALVQVKILFVFIENQKHATVFLQVPHYSFQQQYVYIES